MPDSPTFDAAASYSVAMTEEVHAKLAKHLLQHLRKGIRQEDVCFALWHPSMGSERGTALIHTVLLPSDDERRLDGNVTPTTAYYKRAVAAASDKGMGLAALHSHYTRGWQGMSRDDKRTETLRAASTIARTGLPLLGMTIGLDEAWSARYWLKKRPRRFEPQWAAGVRIVGQRLQQTFHPRLRPRPSQRDELIRTVNVWGEDAHSDLARMHVGVVGLGSVGRPVAEALARMGIQRVTFIDFDVVKRHNLDRLLGAYPSDADQGRLKVHLARDGFFAASTASNPEARAIPESVVEEAGARAALDCDVLFSCVDRPWPRHVLNYLAYAHLIPVIDGGIVVRFKNEKFRGTEWSLRTAAPTRACLQCAGAYDPSEVNLERDGLLDDRSYLQGLHIDDPRRHSENTFPFSITLAGHETLQLIALVTNLLNLPNLGDQRYHYNTGQMKVRFKACKSTCLFPHLAASGESDLQLEAVTGEHDAAHRNAQSPNERVGTTQHEHIDEPDT